MFFPVFLIWLFAGLKIYKTLDIKLAKTAILELRNVSRTCIVVERLKYLS